MQKGYSVSIPFLLINTAIRYLRFMAMALPAF
jgi:hypothetical protein